MSRIRDRLSPAPEERRAPQPRLLRALRRPRYPHESLKPLKIKTIAWIALCPALTIGCKSGPFRDNPDASRAVVVDDDILVNVPPADRAGIMTARSEWSEMKDRVAIAERDEQQGKRQLDVAQEELEAATIGVRTAEKSLELARDADEGVRASEMERASRGVADSRATLYRARLKVAHDKAHISRLDSQTELANMRLEWSEARVELAKALAVHDLGRPEASEISVREFETRVAEKQVQVAMAEIDTEAWGKKVQLRRDALDIELADASRTREQD